MASLFNLTVGEETQWRNVWKKAELPTELAREILNDDNAEIAKVMVSSAQTHVRMQFMRDFHRHSSIHKTVHEAFKSITEMLDLFVEPELLKKFKAFSQFGPFTQYWKKENNIGYFLPERSKQRRPEKVTIETVQRYAKICGYQTATWWQLIMMLEGWAHWKRTCYEGPGTEIVDDPDLVVLDPFRMEGHLGTHLELTRQRRMKNQLWLREDEPRSAEYGPEEWGDHHRFLMTYE
jgi:hypothetical protein